MKAEYTRKNCHVSLTERTYAKKLALTALLKMLNLKVNAQLAKGEMISDVIEQH